jgi:hypothetical protein
MIMAMNQNPYDSPQADMPGPAAASHDTSRRDVGL